MDGVRWGKEGIGEKKKKLGRGKGGVARGLKGI